LQCRPAESFDSSHHVSASFFTYTLGNEADIEIAALRRLGDLVLNSVHEIGVLEFTGSMIVLDVPIRQDFLCVQVV
jgi:hypothetical protein